MPSRRTRRVRILVPGALSLILLVESIIAVAAVDARPTAPPIAPPAMAPAVVPAALPSAAPVDLGVPWDRIGGPFSAPPPVAPPTPPAAPKATAKPKPKPVVHVAPKPAPKPRPKPVVHVAAKPAPRTVSSAPRTISYHGRNHVWMPSLGINRTVYFYACTRSTYPGNVVYRWGCAGRNNVYLFGHASSVFRSLHDAYVRGRLRKGAALWYADGNGKVRKYLVRWWKTTTPDNGGFAFAAQSTPSLTLQTCVGSRSQYRLIVRLTAA
ncbi:MAG: sortase domain-bontaining protein [Chloroflexota bacterium]